MNVAVETFLHFDVNALRRPQVTKMKFTVCPFCGVVSESAHDSQAACIEALQSEIERTRRVLTQVAEAGTIPGFRPNRRDDTDDEESQS
jgi:hypothetical protein